MVIACVSSGSEERILPRIYVYSVFNLFLRIPTSNQMESQYDNAYLIEIPSLRIDEGISANSFASKSTSESVLILNQIKSNHTQTSSKVHVISINTALLEMEMKLD